MWVHGEVSIGISYHRDIGPESDGNGQTSKASDNYNELC